MAHPHQPPFPRATTQLQDLLSLSHVPRWITHPIGRPQSVAEHCYRVTVIARQLLEYMYTAGGDEDDRLSVLEYALDHDGAESKTGDLPSPVKRYIPDGILASIESAACSWVYRPPAGSLADDVVGLADTIEAITWVHTYGTGLKDKFDGSDVEEGLLKRLDVEVVIADKRHPGIIAAVKRVMKEVVPL